MFRIKAIAAVVVAGLGGATMGTDVYLASHTKASPPKQVQVIEQPAPIRAEPAPPAAPAPEPVLMLSPVTIYARDTSRYAARRAPVEAPKEQGLVACSDWRALEAGPMARGVRALCAPPTPADTP